MFRLILSKTIPLFVLAAMLFGLVPDLEAGRSRRVDVATSTRTLARSVGPGWPSFEGMSFAEFYKSLSPVGKQGYKALRRAMIANNGKGADLMRIMVDLKRIESTLKPPHSAYNMGLRGLFEEIGKLDNFARALPGDNAARAAKMVAGMMSKTRLIGFSRPRYNFIKGGVAEIVELNGLLAKGVVKEIQPVDGSSLRMFREALCEGGQIVGKWFLEVKNYPFFEQGKAVRALEGQVASHLDRVKPNIGEILAGTDNIEEAPGILYRFAKAGIGEPPKPNPNFVPFKDAITAKYRQKLLEKALEGVTDPSEVQRITDRVESFLKDRLQIEEVV